MAGHVKLESSEAQITSQAWAGTILGHVLTSTEKKLLFCAGKCENKDEKSKARKGR